MIQLSDEQLNNLGKEALVVIVSSLQDQLLALQSQLDQEPSKEPEIAEVIIPSYHRKKAVGKRGSDLSGLPARIIEHTLSDEELASRFPDVTRNSLLKFINACTSFRKHLSWMNIMSMSMLPKTTMEQS